MELINETNAEGDLFRSIVADDETMLGVVVVKETYRIGPSGLLALDTTNPFPVLREPVAHALGEIPTDMVPWKRATDLFVMGYARAPHARPVTTMRVSVSVGTFSCGLAVFGDRAWVRRGVGLRPSEPKPFVAMELTLARALGEPLLAEDAAEATRLPNVEDPAALVTRWTDRPAPAGFVALPLDSRLRADEMLVRNDRTGELSLPEVTWNSAHPRMRPPALGAGDEVVVAGMSPGAPLRFALPERRFEVHVWLAERRYVFPARPDTLAVFVDEGRLFIVHRCHFTYAVRDGEARVARLRDASAGGAS